MVWESHLPRLHVAAALEKLTQAWDKDSAELVIRAFRAMPPYREADDWLAHVGRFHIYLLRKKDIRGIVFFDHHEENGPRWQLQYYAVGGYPVMLVRLQQQADQREYQKTLMYIINTAE